MRHVHILVYSDRRLLFWPTNLGLFGRIAHSGCARKKGQKETHVNKRRPPEAADSDGANTQMQPYVIIDGRKIHVGENLLRAKTSLAYK